MPLNISSTNLSIDYELSELAHEHAAKYAPMPVHDPVRAGVVSAVVSGVIPFALSNYVSVGSDEFVLAVVILVLSGFVIPFWYFKRLDTLHYIAWIKEYEALRKNEQTDTN